MNKSEAIKVLTRQEEIELLQQAQKGKTQEEREKAARLLVYYNQSFVKYAVKGSHYPQNEISSDELTAEGIITLPQSIKDFDLTKSENRLASYAGYRINQGIRSFIKKSQLLPQATPKKKPAPAPEEEGEEIEKKIPNRNFSSGIIYYDKDYQGGEKDDKATSLLDTLADDNEQIEGLIQQRETKRKINDLLAHLEPYEELIIRLFFGIVPTNLAQINRLVIEEKAKDLKKFKVKVKVKEKEKEKEKEKLFESCSQFFAAPHKKEEVAQTLMNREFWEYFQEFPELVVKTQISRRGSLKANLSNQPISSAEQKKWDDATQNNLLSEKAVLRWINLDYQPEDITDPQSQILQKLGVSKKEKEQWQKISSKTKSKDWLKQRLGKTMENWKKNILNKLKELEEKEKISQQKKSKRKASPKRKSALAEA
ncbi:MAG: hypothetical protein MRECE_1c170 [Mycoplasmataceae bacterium CE_OT135]|nr:MAG: hypothetical protein MRECE_37c008 [Mycoplasmataceae bacterium CE_OT135]KLL04380.1 MAG: hypothetical protein MRECE_1c170 [Mycoplasmataceae bacterium CE_OT135]